MKWKPESAREAEPRLSAADRCLLVVRGPPAGPDRAGVGEGPRSDPGGINASEGKWVAVIKCHRTEDKWVRKVRGESASHCALLIFNTEAELRRLRVGKFKSFLK